MPHPFFDAIAFPLHRPDGAALHGALVGAAWKYDEIVKWYAQCGPALPPLAQGAADVVWKEALDKLTRARALHRLCEILRADAGLKAIHAAVDAVVTARETTSVRQLPSGLLFLDRASFRQELGGMCLPEAFRRVLLVRGGEKSGRSWSERLIETVAHDRGDGCVYVSADTVSTLDDVLQQLFAAVSPATQPPTTSGPVTTTDAAWFKQCCVRLQAAAATSGQRWWVVADDLGDGAGGPRLDPVIRAFFEQFVLMMVNPAFAKWFRLVLIDYPDGGTPTRWRKDLLAEDRTREDDIQDAEIASFLAEWARGRDLALGDEDAQASARRILAAVDAEATRPIAPNATRRPRLQVVYDELVAVMGELGKGAP